MPQYNSSSPEQFMGSDESAGSSWRLFYFLLIVFSIVFLSWIGLNVGYRAYLNSSIEGLDRNIAISSTRLEVEDQGDLLAFHSQIINLRRILDSHIFSSKIFPFLESTTGQRVAYTTMDLDVEERQLIINGVTSTFQTLVQQLSFWQHRDEIESIVLNENSTVNDQIRFGVTLIFKENFFLYSDSYLQQSAGGTAPNAAQPTQ